MQTHRSGANSLTHSTFHTERDKRFPNEERLTNIKYWSPSYIADDFFTQMCSTYEGLDWLFGDNKYRRRAAEYASSMCVFGSYFDQYPAYVINKSDLACQQREEIELLATEDPAMLDDIICDVLFRIYCTDNDLRLIYFRDIRGRKLRWRLED
jgi:hypothetical protein